jgi:hypothetical protein
MSMAFHRNRYGVPLKRGKEVIFTELKHPVAGKVISAKDGVYIRTNDGRRFGPCHPLSFDYGDGIDYGARYDVRIEAFNRALNAR